MTEPRELLLGHRSTDDLIVFGGTVLCRYEVRAASHEAAEAVVRRIARSLERTGVTGHTSVHGTAIQIATEGRVGRV